jgi:ATP:ADP antiporter, AAA family
LGTTLDFGQAKRAFALIGSGALLGALSGSIAAAGTLAVAPARALPVGAALLFALASFLPGRFSHARTPPSTTPRHRVQPPSAPRDPYHGRVLTLALLGTVTVTLVDYLFKATVAREIPREDLGRFISGYYVLLNAVALGVELFVTPRVLRAAGVQRVVLIVPAVLLLSSLGFAAFPTLVAVLVLRAGDGALRHSMNRVGIELLHLPLRGESRARLRTLTEVAGLRAGQALASLLVLASIALDVATVTLAWVPVVIAAAWLGAAVLVEGAYVARLQSGLGGRSARAAAPSSGLDAASERVIARALGSGSEVEVAAAVEATLTRSRPDLLPPSILAHPSPDIVLRALDADWDSKRPEVALALTSLLAHENPKIRASALRQLIPHGLSPECLASSRADSDTAVRVTALVALTRAETGPDAAQALLELGSLLSSGDPAGIHALSRALFLIPPAHAGRFALEIAERSDARAVALATEALAKAPDAAHIPALVLSLANREARRSARKALVLLDEPALAALGRALDDHALPRAVRLHVPRTIARFGRPEAVALLERALAARPEEPIAFKILRGLGRIRSEHPELPIDRDLLETDALQTLRVAVATACWRRAVDVSRQGLSGAEASSALLLLSALGEEIDRSLERVFRVMHSLEPTRSFRVVFEATRSEDLDVRARGRELLQYLAPPKLRRALLALLDEGPLSVRLGRSLGFPLTDAQRRALRLARGTPEPQLAREAAATLLDWLNATGHEVKPLLRALASTHVRALARPEEVSRVG